MISTRQTLGALLFVLLALASIRWIELDSPSRLAVAAEPKASPVFKKDGVAFLKKHCIACHGGDKPKADLSLLGYTDDLSVLRDRKKWPDILKMVQSGEMPPKDKPKPTVEEIDAFAKSVNGIFEFADTNSKPDPGRVTVRRLNKVEYNNTIRDLVGVDFSPAEDFPSDDVGHGFDNIGDVLTLSPVLMERYLAAAESIMNRAITPIPPKPPLRALASRWLEPSQQEAIHWRPVPVKGGMLHTPFKLNFDGEYTLRTRVYSQSPDDKPVKVAFLINGKEVKTFDVNTTKEKPIVLTHELPLPPGEARFAVAVRNPAEGDKPRTIFVEWLECNGPKDTRPPAQRKLLAVDTSKPKAEQTREVLTRFVTRAYRRPATKEEVERLARFVEAAEAKGEKWEAGIQLAMQAVLVSPKFLFRLELDDRPDSADARPLDEYQLASRLSYFLWSTMPDDELFDLAARKQLTANLDGQVKRMLKDPKAKALVDNFVMQWLQLRTLKNFQPDSKAFPTFNEKLRLAMLKETELFFEAIIREDRSILDIIDADFTFLNASLARHYGIADTAGNPPGAKKKTPGGKPFKENDFERVSLQNGKRGGILTQASVLAVTSNPTRTSPVKRGRWVLEQILGTPPPPPPPNVPELPVDEKAVASGSLRQRLETHRQNPACANCHARMDAMGFALENFNAIGAYRLKDGDFVIDASGTLPDGKKFDGPEELKIVLKDKKELISRNLAEKMMIYAIGRGLEYYDKRPIDRICEQLPKQEYKFSTLVTEIVKSEPFRMRRGKGH